MSSNRSNQAMSVEKSARSVRIYEPLELRLLRAAGLELRGPHQGLAGAGDPSAVAWIPDAWPQKFILVLSSKRSDALLTWPSAGAFPVGQQPTPQMALTALLGRLRGGDMTPARREEVVRGFTAQTGVGFKGPESKGFDPSGVGESAISMSLDGAGTENLSDAQQKQRRIAEDFIKTVARSGNPGTTFGRNPRVTAR